MIEAKIVADSMSPSGVRLTTYSIVYPRFVHSELLTHRVFSRNAASSRAIPVKKFMKTLRENPASPVWWGKNQPGMQAKDELTGFRLWMSKRMWIFACYLMLFCAWVFDKLGLHKQIANRILEPWFHMRTIITATEWQNFFALRMHPDAQPEIRALAFAMQKQMDESLPKNLTLKEWHLPYVTDEERKTLDTATLLKVCTARCCRVSYLNHEGKVELDKDLKLHARLLADGHMSPFEHAALPLEDANSWSGNFRGWHQYRKQIPNESIFHG